MKKLLALCAIAILSGCAELRYEETKLDGTKTVFHANTLFSNRAITKLALDRKTEKTSQGLALGSLEDQVNVDAIKAAGDIVGTVTQAAVAGAIKGAK